MIAIMVTQLLDAAHQCAQPVVHGDLPYIITLMPPLPFLAGVFGVAWYGLQIWERLR